MQQQTLIESPSTITQKLQAQRPRDFNGYNSPATYGVNIWTLAPILLMFGLTFGPDVYNFLCALAKVLQSNCLYVLAKDDHEELPNGSEESKDDEKKVPHQGKDSKHKSVAPSGRRRGGLIKDMTETMKRMGENLVGTGTSSQTSKKRKNATTEKPAPKPKKPSTWSASRTQNPTDGASVHDMDPPTEGSEANAVTPARPA